jgi:hypothetical protein
MSSTQGRYLHTGQHKYDKRTRTSMSRVGFEHMVLVFERTQTVNGLCRSITVFGLRKSVQKQIAEESIRMQERKEAVND